MMTYLVHFPIQALQYLLTPYHATQPDMKVLKYTEPATVGSGEPDRTVTTTVHAYDQSQLRNQFKSQLIGVAMMAFMHLYMRYTNPLIIQSIIPLKTALESNLVKVHIRGQQATGELARPWKAGGGLLAGLQPGEVKTDKKSVEAAERSGRGGAKEE